MDRDQALLDAVPEFISVGGLLKASPSTEGGRRMIYFEASNEDVDHQNEIVLQKALADSASYYLRHGNVDLSHYTILGPKSGLADFLSYEIGRPVDVRIDGKRTFVKAELYSGDSPMAKNASMVWDSITRQNPPSRWYPSVGGSVLAKSMRLDPKTQQRVAVIEKVRWNNIALDRCPVNKSVPSASSAPIGVFAKSLGGFVVAKALEAGYGTDAGTLTGGGALRKQSLQGSPVSYFDFRDRMAGDIRKKALKSIDSAGMVGHACEHYGMSRDDAAEHVERFMSDLSSGIKKRSKS